MRNGLLFIIAAASLTILPAGPALADWDAKHLKLVRAASTSLRQAVLTVERDLKGKAFSAIANAGEDSVSYTVKIDSGEKAITAQVDGKTGKVTESSTVAGDSAALLKEFAKIKGTLLAAMKAAEATAKGRTFSAVFKRLGGKDVFEIDIAGRDDVEKDVVIDAATGKIRKVAEKSAETGSAASGGAPAQ